MIAPESFFVGLVAFSVIALGVIIFLGTRARRQQEADNRELTADTLRQQLRPKLLDGPLIWGVWQGLLSAGSMRLLVRDGSGARVTEIVRFALPQDGVRQAFELDGRRYECISPGVLRGRSLLRDAHSGDILLSCRHRAFRLSFFRGETDELLFELTHLSVFHAHARLEQSGRELGRLLSAGQGTGAPFALTLRPHPPPMLALCFLLLSLP